MSNQDLNVISINRIIDSIIRARATSNIDLLKMTDDQFRGMFVGKNTMCSRLTKLKRYLLLNKEAFPHLINQDGTIKNELLKFRDSFGWVYSSSSKQGNRVINIEKQTKKLKDLIPNFTLHYMRNVIVSAMAEQGVSATLMSGALGHNNTSTLSKYLSLNHVEGSIVANKTIEGITKGK